MKVNIEKAKKLSEAAKEKQKAERELKNKKKMLETAVKQNIGVNRNKISVDYAIKRAEAANKKYDKLV